MTVTLAQKFQIGGIVISALTGSAALFAAYGLSSNTVSAIVGTIGVVGTIWNGIGTILTGSQSQVAAVAAHIDDPSVKIPIAQALTSVVGVKSLVIDPNKADAALLAAAASTSQANSKIEAAK